MEIKKDIIAARRVVRPHHKLVVRHRCEAAHVTVACTVSNM